MTDLAKKTKNNEWIQRRSSRGVSAFNLAMRNAIGGLIAVGLCLSGCTGVAAPTTPGSGTQAASFVAPSLAPPVLANAAGPATPGAVPTACTNGLTFLSDVTLPDGTGVPPSATLDKRWQVQNSGTCNWNEHYRFQLMSGPALGAPEVQSLYPARGGTQLTLRLALTAPAKPGPYRSQWQAIDPQGNPFGDPVYLDIVVQ
jgi:hypothetical protein